MQSFSKAIAAIMLTVMVCLAAGCTKDNGGNGTYNGHDYVDLGLRSGTLWATCNVGAENPEDYGDYFAWGETQTKTTYNWSTYLYCNGDYNQLTKYCTQSDFGYNGFTDNLKTLESGDDAATANWGEGWSIPTNKQWVELLTRCDYTWTTQNGVNGFLFTARNGNSIFLPAAGCCTDTVFDNVGSGGRYWSSSLSKSFPDTAKGFSFSWNGSDWIDHDIYDYSREFGLVVRPVRSAK